MIQSHVDPYRSLQQHVAEVRQAAEAILATHSKSVKRQVSNLLEWVISFHDLGKATTEFQKYIRNPLQYRSSNRLKKAHAPVSLLIWLNYAVQNNIESVTILIVAAVIWKHHGDFPTFPQANGLRESLDYYDYSEDFDLNSYPLKKVTDELNLSIPDNVLSEEIDLYDIFEDDFLEQFGLKTAAQIRLKAQLVFSLLLESDRTFLALKGNHLSLRLQGNSHIHIPESVIDSFLEEKLKGSKQNEDFNRKKTTMRKRIVESSGDNRIESVTLPTGYGKTLTAAEWALHQRNTDPTKRKVIIVLPFLSIIDQTVREYKKLFESYHTDNLILEAHSIATRKYFNDDSGDAHAESNSHNEALDFYTDTWSSDFVITTFDQFLTSILSSQNSHLLRFHNLADALIIIDEIQALPTCLWEPVSIAFQALVNNLNSKFLIMSATQPGFIPTRELTPNPETIFQEQNRYRLILYQKSKVSLDDFIAECVERFQAEYWERKKVLIVLNTRTSARKLLDAMIDNCPVPVPVYFLSADVIPKERLKNIMEIKERNKPCLVIATQCIEAGVDIDMDFVIRDLAPLDSLVQCAGRCNRFGLNEQGIVEIRNILSTTGKSLARMVYDPILLEKTETLLSEYPDSICENQIFQLVKKYYDQLRKTKDLGYSQAEDWAFWKEELNVKKMLRGENRKFDFVVVSQDSPDETGKDLRELLVETLQMEDRWERKRKLRSLSGRIAQITVSVWAKKELIPEEISEKIACYYLLKDEYYIPGRGFEIGDGYKDPSIFIV